jgi:prevent-host-death family protein
MIRRMTATQAKAKLLGLLDDVADGETVEITRHGTTVARLVPARGPSSLRGRFAGVTRSSDRDDELFSTGEEWQLT